MRAAPFAALTILLLGAARVEAQEGASLPEGNAYVRSLLTEQRKQDDAINDFTFDLEETREKLDKKGGVTSSTNLRYQVYFVKGRRIRRLISRNGVPLTPKEQGHEDRKAAERAREVREGRVITESAGVRLSSLLPSFDFRTLGRSEAQGRSVLELEFRPGKDRPHEPSSSGSNNRVLQLLSGRIAIDELDKRVVRIEASNEGPLSESVGTGVKLGAIDFRAEFVRVADGVWLPLKVQTFATGRAFLFATFRERRTSTYSNYQRFRVDTEERTPRP